jgi:hypothetical protein
MPERTQDLEEQIVVREVTHLQASWAERERGASGVFTFQLILDQGAGTSRSPDHYSLDLVGGEE